MQNVAITGLGLLAPIGSEPEAFWRSLIHGSSGIARITRFDPTSYVCQVAGEVHDRSYEELIDPRKLRTTTHVTQLALGATELALRDARLPVGAYDPAATGVSVGTALGGWREGEQQYGILLERGARRVNPFIASGAPLHNPTAEIAAAVKAQGSQTTYSTGCPASLQAIGYGAALIANGELDICLAGGVESPLSPVVIAAMGRTQELAAGDSDPQRMSRPFDRQHAGMVLSEGGCFVVLESAAGARRRGARVYAEVAGFASSSDALGVYGYDPSGEPGAAAIHRLLARAMVSPVDVDYVCAHANSSPAFDLKETVVIKKAFGECAARLPISSIKGVLGHPFGASGAFQVATACLAIREGIIPPTHNLDEPAPGCDLDYVPGQARSAELRHVLVTSYGYGGVNAYLLLTAPGA